MKKLYRIIEQFMLEKTYQPVQSLLKAKLIFYLDNIAHAGYLSSWK